MWKRESKSEVNSPGEKNQLVLKLLLYLKSLKSPTSTIVLYDHQGPRIS